MVIQRWQTVYLLMAVLVLGIASFVPAFSVVSPHYSYDASLSTIFYGQSIPSSMVGYFILVALSAVMSLITIFKFKVLIAENTLFSSYVANISCYIAIRFGYFHIARRRKVQSFLGRMRCSICLCFCTFGKG